jgi:hypothetical protein
MANKRNQKKSSKGIVKGRLQKKIEKMIIIISQ